MTIDESIRRIAAEEVAKFMKPVNLTPVPEFCKQVGIDRKTLWRAEKQGKLKLTRIGDRTFVDTNQFADNKPLAQPSGSAN